MNASRHQCMAALLAVTWAVMAFAHVAVSNGADEPTAELIWKNGDALAGRPASGRSASEKRVIFWETAIFSEPLQLDPSALDALVFPPVEGKKGGQSKTGTTAPFRVVTRSGEIMDGEIVAFDGRKLTLRHTGKGDANNDELSIPADSIREIVQLNAGSLLLYGAGGMDGWKGLGRSRDLSGWRAMLDGRMVSKRWRGAVSHPLNESSDTFLVDIQLSSESGAPEFSVSFDDFQKEGLLKLETWENEVVLSVSDRFERVTTLDASDRELRFIVSVDRTNTKVSVQTVGRKKDTTATIEFSGRKRAVDSSRPQLRIENRGTRLTVDRLIVRERDTDSERANATPGTTLESGEHIPAKLTGWEKAGDAWVATFATADGATRKITTDEILIMDFGEAPQLNKANHADESKTLDHLRFFDGRHFSGRIESIDRQFATLTSAYSAKAIQIPLAGLSEVQFSSGGPEDGTAPVIPAAPARDHLFSGGHRVKGRVVSASEEGKGTFSWLCVGALEPAAVNAGSEMKIVLGQLPGEGDGAWQSEPEEDAMLDRLVLDSNEVLGCRIEKIDETAIYFTSDAVELTSLPVSSVRAVEFARTSSGGFGFNSPSWEVLADDPTSVLIEGSGATLLATKNGGIGHPGVLVGKELEFDLGFGSGGRGGALRIGLFGSIDDGADEGVAYTILISGDRAWVAPVQKGQGFTFPNGGIQELGSLPIKVRLDLADDQVKIFLNDQLAVSEPIDGKKKTGNALVLETDPMSVRYGGPESTLTIDNFVSRREKGSRVPIRVSSAVQNQALMVPRFRRDRPPSHVLIATNGDVLRGQLLAADTSSLVFQSRLDELAISRDRVAAAIWLLPEDVDKSPDEDENEKQTALQEDTAGSGPILNKGETRVVMNDGTSVHLNAAAIEDGALTGVSAKLGSCRIPMTEVRELHNGGTLQIDPKFVYRDWQWFAAAEPVIPDGDGDGGVAGGPEIGSEAGELKVSMLNGGQFILSEQRGKIVVLDFWASWCGPCIQAIPDYVDALSEFDEKQVIFIGVNQGESAADITEFMKRRNWKFAVGLDLPANAGAPFGVSALPHTVVIGPEGKIRKVTRGYTPDSGQRLRELIEELLEPEPKTKN